MPGIQVFPTPIKAHYLNEISDLKKYSKYGVKIAFADHISGDVFQVFPFAALELERNLLKSTLQIQEN